MKEHTFSGDSVPKRLNLEQLTIDIAAFLGKPVFTIQVTGWGGGTTKLHQGGKETVTHHEPGIRVLVPDDVAKKNFSHIVVNHAPPQTDAEMVAGRENARKLAEFRSLLNSPETVTLLKETLKS